MHATNKVCSAPPLPRYASDPEQACCSSDPHTRRAAAAPRAKHSASNVATQCSSAARASRMRHSSRSLLQLRAERSACPKSTVHGFYHVVMSSGKRARRQCSAARAHETPARAQGRASAALPPPPCPTRCCTETGRSGPPALSTGCTRPQQATAVPGACTNTLPRQSQITCTSPRTTTELGRARAYGRQGLFCSCRRVLTTSRLPAQGMRACYIGPRS